MTALRTDVHSPKNLTTEDYTYVGAFDSSAGDPGARGGVLETYQSYGLTVEAYSPVGANHRALDELLTRSQSNRPHGDSDIQCDHCGARLRYVAVLLHVPTGTHIAVGETCLDNRFSRATSDFQQLRKEAALDRAKQRIKTAAREYVAGLSDSLGRVLDRETDLAPIFAGHDYALRTVTDIRRKLWDQYGSLTERQLGLVEKLVREAPEKREVSARIAAERAAETRIPAPEGRIEISGTVVGRKETWSDYAGSYGEGGYIFKITVKDDRGFLVWMTEPSKVVTSRGDRIKVKATLKRSDRDESFAFGKRPTGVEILGHVELGEEISDALD